MSPRAKLQRRRSESSILRSWAPSRPFQKNTLIFYSIFTYFVDSPESPQSPQEASKNQTENPINIQSIFDWFLGSPWEPLRAQEASKNQSRNPDKNNGILWSGWLAPESSVPCQVRVKRSIRGGLQQPTNRLLEAVRYEIYKLKADKLDMKFTSWKLTSLEGIVGWQIWSFEGLEWL